VSAARHGQPRAATAFRTPGPDSRLLLLSRRSGENDVIDDVLGIPAHTSHQRRAQRI